MSLYYIKIPGFDTKYKILVYQHGQEKLFSVQGFRVGCFAVRRMPGGSLISNTNSGSGSPTEKFWVVDHIPGKRGVINVSSLHDAMIVADDLSRFSDSDPGRAHNWEALAEALGPKLMGWLKAIAGGYYVLGGFRAFRAKQSPYLLEVAHDMELPYEEVRARYQAKDPDVCWRRAQVKKEHFRGYFGGH